VTEYSVKDVAALFGLQEARLRYWAQTGFIGPSVRRGGRFYYTFQDLIAIKVAKELLDAGLSLQAARKSLDALRATLPHVDRPLTELRITADGNGVIVAGVDAPFVAHSGQVVMTFLVKALSDEAAGIAALPTAVGPAAALPAASKPRPDEPKTGYAAFVAGVAAQDAGDTARAERLYRRAIELDPALAAAWTNLAIAWERRGARGEAREAYERALALDPDQAEARYNLANLLADAGELELAAAEYRRALALAPELADAHYNLALVHAKTGAAALARRHLTRYLELDEASPWAERARAMLAAT
jgi:tetratricopeptide (TPR) repeat protein